MGKDLEAVINSAVESAVEENIIPGAEEESSGAGDTTKTTAVDGETTTTEPASETKTEEIDALMDEFIKEGYKPRQGVQKKDNRIPYSNVQKIIGNRETRAVEAVAKAMGVDAKTLKFDGLESAVSEKLSRVRDLEATAENFQRIDEIVSSDPDRYIRILATVEPEKYGKFLKVLDGEGDGKKSAPNPEEELLREMPEMDVEIALPDGTTGKTYSAQALQKMFLAAVKVGERRAAQAAEGVVKPLQDEREQTARARAVNQHVTTEMESAMTWRGMDEYFSDVLEALKADTAQATRNGRLDHSKLKYRNIRDAYIAIVPGKLAEKATVNEQDVRKRLLAEAKKPTTSTTVTGDGTRTAPKTPSDDPVTDAIFRSLDKAGLTE